jgi:hypothetical protein
MTDELDAVRAPVPVGVDHTFADDGHPLIDARSIIDAPRPRASVRARRAPDPLGVLEDPVFAPVPRRGGRSRVVIGVAAVVVVLLGVGVAAIVGGGDGGGRARVAGSATSTTVAARASLSELQWGYDPQVCSGDNAPCYTVGVDLAGYAPGRRLEVACVAPDVPPGMARPTFVGDDGGAHTRVECPDDPGARSISVTVDGKVAATLDLPATIVPAPSVTVSVGRPAADQPACSTAACHFVDLALAGFDPGAEVTVTCHAAAQGTFGAHLVAIGTDGTATSSTCYFGYPGEQVWADADGTESNRVTWPAD